MQIKSMNGCYINHQTVLSTFDIAIKTTRSCMRVDPSLIAT